MVITSILDDFWDQLPAVGRVVQWTPLGAPWAAPIAVYQGELGTLYRPAGSICGVRYRCLGAMECSA